jgi:hypothetical protein
MASIYGLFDEFSGDSSEFHLVYLFSVENKNTEQCLSSSVFSVATASAEVQ